MYKLYEQDKKLYTDITARAAAWRHGEWGVSEILYYILND